MKYIVIDLEMNKTSKEYIEELNGRKREVIQIGAVAINEQYEEIGNFATLVKPRYNARVESQIERLTGITTEMVQDAPYFPEALQNFCAWCRSFEDDIEIIQWSKADHLQIEREMEYKGIELSEEDREVLNVWNDFQSEYGEKLGVEKQLSLEQAVMYAGLDFNGDAHNALCDARNTAILVEILRTPEKCKKALDNVIEAFKPKAMGASLGDLFDFSKFV